MKIRFLVIIIISVFSSVQNLAAQHDTKYLRIANIVVDSLHLESYKQAVKEHAETAVKEEAGVLMLYAVYEQLRPSHVTVFEIYASKEAYQIHIKTPHFLKYKTTVQHMVKSLELIDANAISLSSKNGFANF